MKRHAIVTSSLLFLGIATVAGCATHKGPNTFNRSEVGAKQTVSAGTVTGVRDVTITTDGSNVGTATGAVLGGLAGSTVGGGRGQTAATVGGAAAGAAVGNAASSSRNACSLSLSGNEPITGRWATAGSQPRWPGR